MKTGWTSYSVRRFCRDDIEANGHAANVECAGSSNRPCFSTRSILETGDTQIVFEKLYRQSDHVKVVSVGLAAKSDPHDRKALFGIQLRMQEKTAERFEVGHADSADRWAPIPGCIPIAPSVNRLDSRDVQRGSHISRRQIHLRTAIDRGNPRRHRRRDHPGRLKWSSLIWPLHRRCAV